MRTLPLFIALTGCASGDFEQRAFVAPLDGQSAVPVDMPLLVRAGNLDLPPDYPLPDNFVRVVDLIDGGLVAGLVERNGGDVIFRPESDWKPDHRYAWTLDDVLAVPHSAEFSLPDHLLGTGVFDTSASLFLLDAAKHPEENAVCLVFSRPVDETDASGIRITVDDAPVDDLTLWPIDPDAWNQPHDLLDGDTGGDVMCMTTDVELAEGAVIRMWWSDAGPWNATIKPEAVEQIMARLRRGNW